MPGIYHDPKLEAKKLQDLQSRLSPNDDPNWLLNALGSDFQRGIGALTSGVMAPATALSGQYDQREIDPSTGAVSPVDPRMVTDASNMAALASVGSAGMVPKEALGMGIKAYHGSPHSFDKFDASKIGTGEGMQAYGRGLYFAEKEGVAQSYRDALTKQATPPIPDSVKTPLRALDNLGFDTSREAMQAIRTHPDWMDRWDVVPSRSADEAALAKAVEAHLAAAKKTGSMYQVDISAEPEHFLDWEKPVSEQSKTVQDAVSKLPDYAKPLDAEEAANVTGQRLHQRLVNKLGEDGAAEVLKKTGIPGVKYLDAGSRVAGDGTRNYVVFDDKHVNIDRKYARSGGAPNVEPDVALNGILKLST